MTPIPLARVIRFPHARRSAALAAILLSAAVGCSDNSPESSATASNPPGKTASSRAAPSIDLKKPVVRLETGAGKITLQLDGVRAPGTVRNFLNYAGDGFYDNTLVHYVDPGNMIVAGGYTADRAPKAARPPIRNEAHNELKNVRGTIAMARDQSLIDSATSQFFINLADAPQRDHRGDQAGEYGYCVFGHVIDGLEVADAISRSATANAGVDLAQTPQPPVVIKSVRVVR